MNRYLLPAALFAGLVLVLAVGLRLNPREVPSPLVGKPAPAFSAERLDAPGRVGAADMAGRVWLLNVWASWCAPCREEHPLLVDFAAGGAVAVVGLNYKDQRADAERWLRAHGNPYAATAFDPQGRVGIDYGVYGVPETFVIDRRGVLRYKHVGVLTRRVLDETIRPLIEELERG